MNPCPCGYYQTNIKHCECSNQSILKYKQKISGPISDRIDIFVSVDQIKSSDLIHQNKNSSANKNKTESEIYREKIQRARQLQYDRQGFLNSKIPASKIHEIIKLNKDNKLLLKSASEKLELSARAIHKILKLSRTIADLENSPEIKQEHLLEAISFRRKSD